MDIGQHQLPHPQTASVPLLCPLPAQEAQDRHQGVLTRLSLGDLRDNVAEAVHTFDLYPVTQAGSGTTLN